MEPMANNHRLQAVQQLRELILCGTFAPGERITEAALAERLAISRTPIRQALPALCQEGLLVQRATAATQCAASASRRAWTRWRSGP